MRHLFIGIFNFCIFPPKVCTRVYIFPPNICRILCPKLLTIFLRFCDYHEICTLLMLKSSATCLRAQAFILRSTGLSVKDISKKLKNLNVGQWNDRQEMTALKITKEREDRKSLMRQLKEFWTKLITKGKTRPDSFHNN